MSNKTERIKALLAGERVHPPVASFFGHRHALEQSPETLVPHLIEQNRLFGWDFIKVQSRATYYGEAWGCEHVFDAQQGPVMVDHVIKDAADYYTLPKLDITQGPLAEHVRVAEGLAADIDDGTPHVHTVFAPLTILNRLGGAQRRTEDETNRLRAEIEQHPDAIRAGLETVTATLVEFVRALIRAGGDGIFITTTGWDADHFAPDLYREWAEPYERRLFEAARDEGAWLNIIHACRAHTHFDIVKDYPVEIVSYDALSGRNPTIAEARELTDKVLWSGIDIQTLAAGDVEKLRDEVSAARDASQQWERLILGPTCAVPPSADPELLHEVRRLSSEQ